MMHWRWSKSSILPAFIVYLAFVFIPARGIADDSFKPNVKPLLTVPSISDPIKIDGKLDEAAWRIAGRADNFAEHQPGDNVRPPVNTIALVAYDNENFYMGFLAYDDPKTIRASLRDRDEAFGDDDIGVILDTYGDGSWAYEIFVNPLGVQGDVRWTNGNEDASFDIVYQAAGAITDSGYQVEVAIPFKSLRFPNKPVQTWRAAFWRNRPRASREQYTWASIDRNKPCFPCQFGTLTGIKDVKPGRNFELLPSVTGYQSAALRNPDSANSGLKYNHAEGRVSLGASYSLSSSSTAELTYKPDFSQVESDVDQIDVNSNFALFYPEKRPFFQEGAELFSTQFSAVYTRSINDPLVAGKIVGRMGRFSIAELAARDDTSFIVVPLEEGSPIIPVGKNTSNIIRARHTFWEDSFIGGLVTARTYDVGGSGSLGGIDGSMRLSKNYSINFQALATHTAEPNDTMLTKEITEDSTQRYFDRGRYTVAFDGESYWGRGLYAGLSRDAKHLSFNVNYREKSPAFRGDNGIISGNSNRQGEFWTGYTFYTNNSWIDRFTTSFDLARVWNFSGIRKDEWFIPEIDAQLKGQTSLSANYIWSNERYRGIDFGRIHRWAVDVNSNFSDPVTASIDVGHGRFIARLTDPPVLGNGTNVGFSLALKPWSKFIISPSFSYSRLDYPDGGNIFEGYILRTRFSYQFSISMFARLVMQYDDFDRNFRVEPLLSYKLNPFSIFYIGSTQAFDKFDGQSGMTQTAQQFFMKFQYLFRL